MRRLLLAVVTAVVVATACGGGGDDTPTGPTKGPAGVFPGVGPASSVAERSERQQTTTLPGE